MLKKYSIKQALIDGFSNSLQNEITIAYEYRDGNTGTPTTETYVIDKWRLMSELARWSEWSMLYDDDLIGIVYNNPDATPLMVFSAEWIEYFTVQYPNWSRILSAYMSKYNPLANYDMAETTVYGVDVNTTAVENDAEGVVETYSAPHATLVKGAVRVESYSLDSGSGNVVTETPATTENEYTHTFDTLDVTDYQKSKHNTTGSNTTTQRNTQAASFQYKTDPETTTTDTRDEHTDTVSRTGNIGVMTTQEIIEKEMSLRNFNIVRYIIEGFVKSVTAYYPYKDGDDDGIDIL